MASKFIKGLTEKLTMLVDDWFVIQPDAEESTAYKIKQSNALVSKLDKSTTEPNTWYVNTNGDDTNVGSANFPFLTIQAAHDAAADKDIIIIQNLGYVQDLGTTNISKKLLIKGPNKSEFNQARLRGTWNFTTTTVSFENISLVEVIFAGSITSADIVHCDISDIVGPSSNNLRLNLFDVRMYNDPITLKGIQAYSSEIQADITSGSSVYFVNVNYEGDINQTVSSTTLINSFFDGNLTTVSNLSKYNSVITGTETVSGTTTVETQAQPTPNTWYVNVNGSDSDKGSLEFPFATIQAAHDAAAAGDIIDIAGSYNTVYSENITITKHLVFRGQTDLRLNDFYIYISGTWTVSGPISPQHFIFENLYMGVTWVLSSQSSINVYVNHGASEMNFPGTSVSVKASDCTFYLATGRDMSTLNAYNCTFLNNADLNTSSVANLSGCTFAGNLIAGGAVSLKNTTIEGTLNVTGNFVNHNSVVIGTETVSGTTTEEVQDDVTKLSLTAAADQVVVSNVEFQKQILSSLVGLSGGHWFGDGDTGLYESVDDTLKLRGGGVDRFQLLSSQGLFGGQLSKAGAILNETTSITNPTLVPSRSDTNTGIGGDGADVLAAITGGVTAILIEAMNSTFNGAVTQKQISDQTAATGQSVQWTSDGSGIWNAGDVLITSNVGGTPKTRRILDYNAL